MYKSPAISKLRRSSPWQQQPTDDQLLLGGLRNQFNASPACIDQVSNDIVSEAGTANDPNLFSPAVLKTTDLVDTEESKEQ